MVAGSKLIVALRDPLYKSIPLHPTAVALIDTPPFQRLRRIHQLGQASMVYPSAVHTRFTHCVGAYHLARRIVRQMDDAHELQGIAADDRELVILAALLHDVGHYPAAHFLEEYGLAGACHETAGEALLTEGAIGKVLAATGIPDAARRVAAIVQHTSNNEIGALVNGSADVDKIDYIARDCYFAGVDLAFDAESLINGFTLVTPPGATQRVVGLREAAVPAFEQMLIAKANLYRLVYFHATARAATVMMRALVVAALEAELVTLDELQSWTDEEFFLHTVARVSRRKKHPDQRELVGRLAERLTNRQLYHEAARLPLDAVAKPSAGQMAAAEAWLTEELHLEPGDVLLDVPSRPSMLGTDLWIERRSGDLVHASQLGPVDGFALNGATDGFYFASGRVACFTSERRTIDPALVQAAIQSAIATGEVRDPSPVAPSPAQPR